MVTENTTPNRGYQEPAVGNNLSVDINRLVSALRAIDVDVANALAAIVSKAGLASPAFTGTPTAPTAAPGTDSGQLATTAFVKAALTALVDSAPGALDTLNELAAAIGDDPNFAATMAALIGTKADAAATTAALALKADASTAVTLTGSQTLTNKTLTGPAINEATVDGLPLGPVIFGQCVLSYVSTTEVRLFPRNGTKLTVGTDLFTVPAAGVALSNSGLAALTLYYVYALNNVGTLTLEASTTGHSTDATTGIEIKTGDASRTLVGMVMTNASSQFQYDNQRKGVRSWFNRQAVFSTRQLASNASTSSTTNVELTSDLRCYFLLWAGEIPLGWAKGQLLGTQARLMLAFDGVQVGGQLANAGSANMPIGVSGAKEGLSEGEHYSTFMCSAFGSGTLTILGASTDSTCGLRNELYIPGGRS